MGELMKKLLIILLLLSSPVSCFAETVKVYFCINKPVGSVEFNEVSNEYDVEYVEINQRNNKHFYIALIEDESRLSEYLGLLSDKNPKILGAFKNSGLKYGLKVQDEVITGTVKYKLQSNDFLDLMPDNKTFDDLGVELTSARSTKIKGIKNFAGWNTCVFD